MSDHIPEKWTYEASIKMGDRLISGAALGMPIVDYLYANLTFCAKRMSWHIHEGHEILLLLHGATSYEFREGAPVELMGGQFMIVPARLVHRGRQDVRMPSALSGIIFDPGHPPARNSLFTRKETRWLAGQFGNQSPTPLPMSPRLRRMVQSFQAAIRDYAAAQAACGEVAALRLLMASIIVEVARHAGGDRHQRMTQTAAVATAHMERHFSQPIEMNDLAEQVGCSRARLFAVFKRETGMTPNDWLQRHRVQKAGELLAQTQRTLEDIAAAVGFSSSQYFCNVFRKYTGMTPGAHRVTEKREHSS